MPIDTITTAISLRLAKYSNKRIKLVLIAAALVIVFGYERIYYI